MPYQPPPLLNQIHQQAERMTQAGTSLWRPFDDETHVIPSIKAASEHGIATLKGLGLDSDSLAAAAFYPWYVAHPDLAEQLQQTAEQDVADILNGVHELSRFDHLIDGSAALQQDDRKLSQGEGLRRMLLAMIQDPRVLLVRLAWHLYRIENIQHLPAARAKRLAHRTQQLFAPLANRLGIWQIKWQLEDLALRALQPEAYHNIAQQLAEKRSVREAYLNEFLVELQSLFADQDTIVEVYGRAKHIYSIWKKMQLKHKSFEQVSDTLATRVIVKDLPACYAVLGMVHNHWQPVDQEFDDYIARPKPNGYQSLHTAVYGPGGRIIEVQIRSQAMHEFAELGIAAHWQYKESGHSASGESELSKKINWLRQLIDIKDDDELESRLRDEVFEDRVYVFTPDGDIIDLVHNATPLDFAYHIHTNLGHATRGAKVNGRIVPLTYRLNNGDRVEILTNKTPSPSRDWLHQERGYLASARARGKVRHWFRQQDYDDHWDHGEDIVKRELRASSTAAKLSPDELLRGMQAQTLDELYTAVGRGDISSKQIQGAISRLQQQVHQPEPLLPNARPINHTAKGNIVFADGEDLLHYLAKCCQPVPPEAIMGFITKARGVAVHAQSCRNIQRLQEAAPERLLPAYWGSATSKQQFNTRLHIRAGDRPGLLRDISNVLTGFAVNVVNTNSFTDQHGIAHCHLEVRISDLAQLDALSIALQRLPNINLVRRT